MANKNIFKSSAASNAKPVADTTNLAGGKAYAMTDKHALAQFACTGMFGNTFYADAATQLEEIKKLVNKVDPAFISSLAIYSRQSAFMKDMPAYLLASLAARDIDMFKITFPKVMDNGKMVRNFIQIVRSGVTGRKSLGSAPKRMIKQWLESRRDDQVFSDSVGNDPSLSDVIKMVHPRPETKAREALYGYIAGRKYDPEILPGIVREFEAFKVAIADKNRPAVLNVPNVNFQMLTALPLSETDWESIAKNAKWQMTRMNLNTFARHGVFKDKALTKMIVDRLSDKKLIEKAKVFPYQLFTAFLNTQGSADVPESVVNALQDAMEHAMSNVPAFDGKIFVGVDVSGSMDSAVSGYRGTATSKTSCRQVAALIASAIKRKNEETEVFTFDTAARAISLNSRDSVMTNAKAIAQPGGGTDCSSMVRLLNEKGRKGDLVVIVSDNESWFDRIGGYGHQATGLMAEWAKFKGRNPKAKLICIDLTPNATTQAPDAKDRLNVGGFSDSVFTVISEFLKGNGEPEYWVKKITEFDGTPRSVSSTTETDENNKE